MQLSHLLLKMPNSSCTKSRLPNNDYSKKERGDQVVSYTRRCMYSFFKVYLDKEARGIDWHVKATETFQAKAKFWAAFFAAVSGARQVSACGKQIDVLAKIDPLYWLILSFFLYFVYCMYIRRKLFRPRRKELLYIHTYPPQHVYCRRSPRSALERRWYDTHGPHKTESKQKRGLSVHDAIAPTDLVKRLISRTKSIQL